MTTRTTLVLAADPDATVVDLVSRELQQRGMHVIPAANGADALRVADEQRPDLAIIAVNLPGISGVEVLRRLRAGGPLPAVLLSDGRSSATSIAGRVGETLAKPFSGQELVARVAQALGHPPPHAERITAGDIELDLEARVVRRSGRQLSLTRTEWALLLHLARNPGRTLASGDILSSVWGPEYRDDLQFLRVWISRLRAKLGGDGFTITTVRGVGYVFQPEAEAPAPRRRRPTRIS
jgi:two-component system KDP operon response regulator KdpE